MREWLGLLARVVVGGVWIAAGAAKVTDPAASVQAVRAYDLLPDAVVPTVGHLLPVLEVVVGATLVLGVLVRASAVLSALLFVAFIIGIASAWSRGLQIDCGCFGGGGYDPDAAAKYPVELARDAVLLAVSLFLVRWPRSRYAVDNVLLPQRRPAEDSPDQGRDPDQDQDQDQLQDEHSTVSLEGQS
ncbi:MauE/DoxX family redox-associated membrane protein [Nocardioides pantholopis]|uniref:MauE/DoxX family redox-associated membrane protein n=1 Tax=Nocardioides pantholopis TaxID=2483798 RepID=UPI000FDB5B12|nr:MauE/DoxX family redox-associated membrane protein [Nocardioides pantholopis]